MARMLPTARRLPRSVHRDLLQAFAPRGRKSAQGQHGARRAVLRGLEVPLRLVARGKADACAWQRAHARLFIGVALLHHDGIEALPSDRRRSELGPRAAIWILLGPVRLTPHALNRGRGLRGNARRNLVELLG